jgi:Ca-activated chloride channel family protein
MAAPVPGSGGKSKMQLAAEAAIGALPLLADDSELGLWHFATRVDGDRDYREVVPLGPVAEKIDGVSRRDRFAAVARGLKPDPNGNTALYDTALAAFRNLLSNYVPGKKNQIVVLTDGINYDPGGISLQNLADTLEHEFDPHRPVHIITIAYGADADSSALARISTATRAKTYRAVDPNNITQVIVDALLDR